MTDEEKERPEGMSEEEEARESWRNILKHVGLAKIEDAIADTMTKLINDPRIFYVCSISKIEYRSTGDASFNVSLNSNYRETENSESDSGDK